MVRVCRFGLLCCALLLLSTSGLAQWTPRDPFVSVEKEQNGIVASTQSGGALKVEVCTGSVIHLLYSPTGNFPRRPDYVVTKTSWSRSAFKFEEDNDSYTLRTDELSIALTRSTGAVAFADAHGKPLVQETKRLMFPETVNGEQTYRAESVFGIYGSQEGFYGLGQHQAGVWNFRGESIDLSQENTNIAIPLFVSTNGYGIFWNNTSRSRFNNRFVQVLYLSSEVADTIDYYFLYGPDFDKIIGGYRELTGQAPMFGRWAYGFWQSKNRYRSQQEILDVAHQYRREKLPIDNIVQDWFWWNRKGEHVFNKNYPDPQAMIDDLHKNNFHLMISVWPFFEPGSKEYDTMEKTAGSSIAPSSRIRPTMRGEWRCMTRPILRLAGITGA